MLKQDLFLELMKRGKTLINACNELSITALEGEAILEKNNIETKSIIFEDGTVDAIIKNYDNSFDAAKFYNNGDYTIYTKPIDSFKTIVVSDMHFTHSDNNNERYLDQVYEIASKSGIHHILNLGDIVDGMFGSSSIKREPIDQFEFLLNHYPYDKNIFNWYILGDHDISLWTRRKPLEKDIDSWHNHKDLQNKGRVDLERALFNYRDDFISLGLLNGTLHLKNDFIQLLHQPHKTRNGIRQGCRFVLRGHSHCHEIRKSGATTEMFVSPLGDLQFVKDNEVSMYTLEFNFRDGLIKNIEMEHYTLQITKLGGKLLLNEKRNINLNLNKKVIKKEISYEDKRLVK